MVENEEKLQLKYDVLMQFAQWTSLDKSKQSVHAETWISFFNNVHLYEDLATVFRKNGVQLGWFLFHCIHFKGLEFETANRYVSACSVVIEPLFVFGLCSLPQLR